MQTIVWLTFVHKFILNYLHTFIIKRTCKKSPHLQLYWYISCSALFVLKLVENQELLAYFYRISDWLNETLAKRILNNLCKGWTGIQLTLSTRSFQINIWELYSKIHFSFRIFFVLNIQWVPSPLLFLGLF